MGTPPNQVRTVLIENGDAEIEDGASWTVEAVSGKGFLSPSPMAMIDGGGRTGVSWHDNVFNPCRLSGT